MTDIHKKRRERLAQELKKLGLGAAAISPGPNFFYLTGVNFIPYARTTMIFVTETGDLLALLPELERLKWQERYPDSVTFYWPDSEGYEQSLNKAVQALGRRTVGIEKGRLRAFEAETLNSLLGEEGLGDAGSILERQRMVKDAGEISLIESAARAADIAFGNTLDCIRAGMTELDVKRMLSINLLGAGSDGFGYEPLVLCAGNAANPHGTSGHTVIRPGDPILIGCAAKVDSYLADLARTVFCEYATDEHAEIQEAVAKAGANGRAALKAGITAHNLNEIVISSLRTSKFPDLIVHRAGHGCGIAIYEAPYIQENNHDPIPEGNVLILEPGLYRKGDIGVRIEDLMLVKNDGARALSGISRDLTIVGK